jgi:stringent starvation protein B
MSVRIPIGAVLAVYARETGQGMVFAEETPTPSGEPPSGPSGPAGAPDTDGKPGAPRPKLTVVK